MNLTSIGDLSRNLLQRTRSTAIKQDLQRLTQELSTGQVTDVNNRLGGDFAYLTDIDRNLARLRGFHVTATEAGLFTDAAQNSLDRLQSVTSELGNDLLSTVPTHVTTLREHNASRAMGDLDIALSMLNGHVAGRSIFGGIQTDISPLRDAETLLTNLHAEIAGLTDPNDIRLAAQTWFDDPAGFNAVMYQGSNTDLADISVSPDHTVSMTLKANDQDFRDILRNIALTALSTDPTLALSGDTQNNLMQRAGEELLNGQDQLASLRADIGVAQARIEEATVRISVERTSFEHARNVLLEADPFETASRIEEAQFQLESLYAVTVRNSQLSLLNFLK